MRYTTNLILKSALLVSSVLLAACNGDNDRPDGGSPAPATTYTVGGTVSGLTGTVTLANNGGDNQAVSASGPFTFAASLATGVAFNVTVVAQPASQQCTVTNASGTMTASNVANVTVTCVINTFTVGGTVTGLSGSGLVLQNNSSDNLARTADGSFTFATAINSGAAYNVSVLTQPTAPAQTCTPTNHTGNIAANVTNVTITCVTNSTVGSASIGPAGGTVNGFYGATITVPAGALASTVTIGLSRDSSNSPAFAVTDIDAIGATYELTPHGQSFSVPVTLRIPFDPAQLPNDETPVLYKAEAGGAFTALPTTINGDFLEATVTGFSWVIPGAQASKPRMVYAVQTTTATTPQRLASFRVNRTTGALTGPTSTALIGNGPISVVAHPSRRFVYVTNGGSVTQNGVDPGSISTHQLSVVNGNVASTPSSTISLGNGVEPVYPVVHPSGRFLYVATGRFGTGGGDVRMLTINGATGALSNPISTVNGSGAPATGIAFNRLGTLAYVTYIWSTSVPQGNTFYDQVKVYTVDLVTGAFTGPIASVAAGSNPWSIGIDVNDRFAYVASLSSNEVHAYSLNANGTINSLGGFTVQNQPSTIALDGFGRFVFAGKQNPLSTVNVYSYLINSGGTLTQANALLTACPGGSCTGPIAVAADPQGQFVYALDSRYSITAFAVNQTSGVLTNAGSTLDIFRPGVSGVGDPFRFAVTGASPVWQNNCTTSCTMAGAISSGGSGGGGSTTNPAPPTSHNLTVSQNSNIGGVTSSPAGINIESPFPSNSLPANDFQASFPANSTVTLCTTPPPIGGPYDLTWTGSCSGTGQCTSVTMTSDKQCNAGFTRAIGR